MLQLILEYAPALQANQTRTRLLNGRVRGNTAGFIQKLSIICQWASLPEIETVIHNYFPSFDNNTDITGRFVLDGDPSIESVVTPDHYIKNATLTGTAWFDTSGAARDPGVIAIRGELEAP